MNSLDTFKIKRYIFDIFEHSRTMFNDLYNDFNKKEYTNEDKEILIELVHLIGEDLKEIKELLSHVSHL